MEVSYRAFMSFNRVRGYSMGVLSGFRALAGARLADFSRQTSGI